MLATVKKVLITPLHQRFDVNIADGENMEVQGNIVEREYEIYKGRHSVADTYGVDTDPGADSMVILAVTVVTDMMVDQGR